MGHAGELKLEELLRFRVLILVGLVNLIPNIADVSVDNLTDPIKVVPAVVEVSQDE